MTYFKPYKLKFDYDGEDNCRFCGDELRKYEKNYITFIECDMCYKKQEMKKTEYTNIKVGNKPKLSGPHPKLKELPTMTKEELLEYAKEISLGNYKFQSKTELLVNITMKLCILEVVETPEEKTEFEVFIV